jgi:hypothetical protein
MKTYKLIEPLSYDGNLLSVYEILKRWNINRPQVFHQSRANFVRNMRNYANKNNLLKLNTDQINTCLITNNEKHGGYFDGNFYSGTCDLHRFLKSKNPNTVSLSRFSQALRSMNGGVTVWRDLPKEIVLELVSYKSTLAVDGNRGSDLFALYKKISEPKRKWDAVKKHLENYRLDNGDEPDSTWLLSIAKPEERFINDISDDYLLPKDQIRLGNKELYDRLLTLCEDICSFSAFDQRIRSAEKFMSPLPLSYIITLTNQSTYLLLDGHLHITLYEITCLVDGKKYIGITSTTIEIRWRRHLRQTKEGIRPKGGLHEAIEIHGIKNFSEPEILGIYSYIQEARDAEILAIKQQQTRKPNGLNLTSGGEFNLARTALISHNDIVYQSLYHLAKEFKLRYKLLLGRLKSGRKKGVDPLDYALNIGKEKTMIEKAKDAGLKVSTVYGRSAKGMPESDIFDPEIKWSECPCNFLGVDYPSKRQMGIKLSISPHSVNILLNSEENKSELKKILKKAQKLFIDSGQFYTQKSNKKQTSVGGLTFESRSEACRFFSRADSTIYNRLKRGLTIDESFGLSESEIQEGKIRFKSKSR